MTILLQVVNRRGETNTVIELTPPVQIVKDDGQWRMVDAQKRDYAFFMDGRYRGMQFVVKEEE